MAYSASDIPAVADLLVNGQAYMFDSSFEDSPYRKPPASYSWTPTFLERTNVGAGYGDNQQDFFLTASQNDWSLGEMRRFFRSSDSDSQRRYWTGANIEPVAVPGQVTLTRTTPSLTFGGAVRACCDDPLGIYAASSTNLYLLAANGTITDDGAHGLGAAPSQWGVASDSKNVFLSTTGAGTVGVRKWNGSAFSTFSATGADSLAYLNNVLYGYQESTAQLIQYSTGGVATTLFTWQDAAGAALTGSAYATRLRAYGGILTILRKQGSRGTGELWQYDGQTSELGGFPANFVVQDMEVVSGIVLVSGYVGRNADVLPAIFYYISGQVGLLWIANVTGYTNLTWPAIAAYGNGVVFTDDTTGNLMQYDVELGGVHTIGTYTVTNATPMMAANKNVLLHTRNATTAYYYPSTTTNTSGFLVTSLFDFDNSLSKLPRGIKVEFDAATDGDGGSVDIAYQYDSVTGSYTTLQTGAASGTEYALTGTAHSVSVKVTLKKGTSSKGPTLKRVYVRGAPILQAYRFNTYVLDCSGNRNAPEPGWVKLANGQPHNKDGVEMVTDLRTALNAGVISVTDRYGTFNAVIEPGGTTFKEVKATYGRAEYRAEIAVREV